MAAANRRDSSTSLSPIIENADSDIVHSLVFSRVARPQSRGRSNNRNRSVSFETTRPRLSSSATTESIRSSRTPSPATLLKLPNEVHPKLFETQLKEPETVKKSTEFKTTPLVSQSYSVSSYSSYSSSSGTSTTKVLTFKATDSGGGEGLERGRQRYKRNTFSIQKPESLPGEEPTSGKVVSKNATGTCEDKPVRPIFIELINDGEKDVPQQGDKIATPGCQKAESVVKVRRPLSCDVDRLSSSASPLRLFDSLNDRRREIRIETEKCLSQLIANNKLQSEKDQSVKSDLDDTDESCSSKSSSSTVVRNSRKNLPPPESTPPSEPTTSPPPLEHVGENLFLSNLKSGHRKGIESWDRECNPRETEIDKVFRNTTQSNRPYSASFSDTSWLLRLERDSDRCPSLFSLGSLASRESSICEPFVRRQLQTSSQFQPTRVSNTDKRVTSLDDKYDCKPDLNLADDSSSKFESSSSSSDQTHSKDPDMSLWDSRASQVEPVPPKPPRTFGGGNRLGLLQSALTGSRQPPPPPARSKSTVVTTNCSSQTNSRSSTTAVSPHSSSSTASSSSMTSPCQQNMTPSASLTSSLVETMTPSSSLTSPMNQAMTTSMTSSSSLSSAMQQAMTSSMISSSSLTSPVQQGNITSPSNSSTISSSSYGVGALSSQSTPVESMSSSSSVTNTIVPNANLPTTPSRPESVGTRSTSRFSYGDGKSSFLSQLSGVASSAASLIVGGSPSHQYRRPPYLSPLISQRRTQSPSPAKQNNKNNNISNTSTFTSSINSNNNNINSNNNNPTSEGNLSYHGTPVRKVKTAVIGTPQPSRQTTTLLASLDKSILQIRDWLTVLEDMLKKERVDLSDFAHICHMLERQRNVLRELEQKKPQLDDLVRTAENLRESPIRQQIPEKDCRRWKSCSPEPHLQHIRSCLKVSQLREHWETTSSKVMARRNQLEDLLVDNQQFDAKRREVEAWLGRMEAWLSRMRPVGLTADVLETQIREQKSFHAEVHQYKIHVEEFNQLTQELISSYQQDDTTKVKKITEQINLRYDHLNTSIMSRGKMLHSGMTSLNSFQPASDRFCSWLSEIESNVEILEATGEKLRLKYKDKDIPDAELQKFKDIQLEIDSERENFQSLTATGRKILIQMDGGQGDSDIIQKKLEEINQRWNHLKAKSVALRNRLENNSDHWNALFLSLRELAEWTVKKESELESMGPLGGDEASIRQQQDASRAFRRQLEDKRAVIENNLLTGKQHLGAKNEGPSSLSSDTSESDANDFQELNRGIRREVSRLSEHWIVLLRKAEEWHKQLDEMLPKIHTFQKSLEAVMQRLYEAECEQSSLNQTNNFAGVSENEILLFRNQLKIQSANLQPLQRMVEDINDQASDFTACNIALSTQILLRLEDINTRWKLLQLGLDEHYKKLNEFRNREVPTTQDFLSVAVHYPWARAISQNKVPYYINHQSETTHWDHPDMVVLFKNITEFNTVRFSAYRTAMKLREVQKTLALHLLNLNVAIEAFDAHGLRGQNDKVLDVADMITVLSSLYETIAAAHPTTVNVPLCLDLTLNWLLNVYDCQRTGHVRVLSFKLAIAVLSQGPLEEKYRYMFRLIADQHRRTTERKLGLLLHDCIQIPRVLGELAAFGGSNVEPSVKSCFEKAGKDSEFIEASNFLNWMKQEPQSMVWLPVLHRFIAAESARHQAKCNICKQSPIQGFRYRCLKCFNFDMCQTCFFAGKGGKYKNHKMTHPMQEYCTTTTSGEDMRDFTQLLKNKFKSKKYFRRNTRLGYLPVQSSGEGSVMSDGIPSSPGLSPQKTISKADVNERLADRLAELETRSGSDESNSTRVTPQQHSEPKKPFGQNAITDEHSLIAQYCQNLHNGDLTSIVPDSPLQIMTELDTKNRQELENRVRELECENISLQEEYQHLKASSTSPTTGGSGSGSNPSSSSSGITGITTTSNGNNGVYLTSVPAHSSDAEILQEAKMLREHKDRLESRMKLLAVHNTQLESQLGKLKQILQESNSSNAITSNKTGTLNTKSVTASQLATNSPILPHKMNGNCAIDPNGISTRGEPPALPPRGVSRGSISRESSLNNKPPPPLVPPKRTSLTRSDLALFSTDSNRTNSLPRREMASQKRDFSLTRMGSIGNGAGNPPIANWTDSLPRRDFYNMPSNNNNSLPRRDRAGLGRPEPSSRNPIGGPGFESSTENVTNTFGTSLMPRRRDSSLNRDNPFRDALQAKDKRNSTGNLYFGDARGCTSDNSSHGFQGANGRLGGISSTFGHSQPIRVDSTTSINYDDEDGPHNEVSRELRTAAGDLGKELKNLITMMDQDDDTSISSTMRRTTNTNKESPTKQHFKCNQGDDDGEKT